ncbi:NAD-dependent epimerase/dehydratase family protein [Corticibacter populi]|uniref:NAD-dependent epimerase/dehydratase family protein n=1 Tax=Corticibacter populi TaxID=1550736 RepID=UPI003BF8B9EE
MPLISLPPRALPARFRRSRVLVIGCGDVGLRMVRQRAARSPTGADGPHGPHGVHFYALTSDPDRRQLLREAGVTPLLGNLDQPRSLRRLAGLATYLVHLAPPQSRGEQDLRSRALLQALRRARPPAACVYVSTSGVYGDCQGQWVRETRAPAPMSARARRRLDAERMLRRVNRAGWRTMVLRAPGIYALDRAQGTPAARLQRGTPVLRSEDDVFTNHIHADDLARACWLALWRGAPGRVFNANDDTVLRMGDYFDLAARLLCLPAPPRISREQAQNVLTPAMLSFMSESRRLDNHRLKHELRLRLHYPTVTEGLGVG